MGRGGASAARRDRALDSVAFDGGVVVTGDPADLERLGAPYRHVVVEPI